LVIARLAAGAGDERLAAGSRHFLSADGRRLLVRITGNVRSSDIEGVRRLLAAVHDAEAAAIAESSCDAAEIRIGHAGGYALAAESERVMRTDLERNITLSIALVVLLLLVSWRRPRVVALAVVPLAVGIFVGFGVFSIVRREIVVLALVSGAVLAALGIDFVIHVVEPLRHDRRGIVRESVVDAVRVTGRSLFLAGVTTILAFSSFVLLSDGFLRDLGLLTACGIAACFSSTVFLLPALLAITTRTGGARRGATAVAGVARTSDAPEPARAFAAWSPSSWAVACAEVASKYPLPVLIGTFLTVAVAVVRLTLSSPEVESDLRRLHPADMQALRVETELREAFGSVSDPVLLRVEAPHGSRDGGGDPSGVDPESGVLNALARLDDELYGLRDAGVIVAHDSAVSFLPPPVDTRRVLDVLVRKDADALASEFVAALEDEGFEPDAFRDAVDVLRAAVAMRRPLRAVDLQWRSLARRVGALLSVRPDGATGLVAVRATDRVWSSDEQEALFERLREAMRNAGVVGETTGIHAASLAAARHVVAHFVEATGLALGVVVLVVALLLREPRRVVAALVPVAVGCVWTMLVWDALDYRLNLMNVGILPMVLGIGVDDGIHLVARWAAQPSHDVGVAYRHTGPAVLLTTLTTIAAFGTLAFSQSPGLASVGLLCAFGVGFCLLASVTVLPAVLTMTRRRS